MKPPSGGPRIGPTSAGMVTQDIAAIICDRETERSSTSLPTGSIMAPPSPCRMRASTKASRLGAMPHSTEAAVKTRMAARNTRRAPKWSATQPLAGMNTERLMR